MAGGIIEGQQHTRLSSARYTQEDISKGVMLWHFMFTRQKQVHLPNQYCTLLLV